MTVVDGGVIAATVVEIVENAIVHTIHPAMNLDLLTASPGRLNDRIVGDVVDLGADIELGQQIGGLAAVDRPVENRAVVFSQVAQAADPVIDQPAGTLAKGRTDTTAGIVTADDHMLDPQDLDGELQRGEEVQIGMGAQVGDVPVNEDFPGIDVHDLGRRHPRVGTPHPEITGCLLLGQSLEELWILPPARFGPVPVAAEKIPGGHGHGLRRCR